MSSGLKRYISPLATQGPSPQKIPRPNDYTERVALAESRRRVTAPQVAPEEGDGPAFTFGDIRATSSFTFISPHLLNEVAPPATPVPGALDVTSPTSPDKEPTAGSTTIVTPVLSNSPTPEFYSSDYPRRSPKELTGESAPVDDLMDTTDLGSPPGRTPRESALTTGETPDEEQSELSYASYYSQHPTPRESATPVLGETPDEERSELSYASYQSQYPTDRSIALQSSDGSGTDGTTSHDRRSPYVAISSREHSLYQARRSRSDGVLVGLLDAVEALRRLSNSDNRISNPPTSTENQVVDARNEVTGPLESGSGLPNVLIAMEVRDADGPVAVDVKGPRPSANPHSRAGPRNVAANAPVHPVDDATAPTHNPTHEGAAPPPVDTRAPSVPPLRRVRARGVFIIGNGAPIKIDESIEVNLRDGVDGQVDFII